jgi:hypothetical protein
VPLRSRLPRLPHLTATSPPVVAGAAVALAVGAVAFARWNGRRLPRPLAVTASARKWGLVSTRPRA